MVIRVIVVQRELMGARAGNIFLVRIVAILLSSFTLGGMKSSRGACRQRERPDVRTMMPVRTALRLGRRSTTSSASMYERLSIRVLCTIDSARSRALDFDDDRLVAWDDSKGDTMLPACWKQ